ncbi:MAG: iron-sulfur cluster assembly protein, partial [Alphaproteobacteria bacterium]
MSKIAFITAEPLPANATLREKIVAALQEVYDPELPVNLWDLGLIYDIAEHGDDVVITMTLTAPNCPVADLLPRQVKEAVAAVTGGRNVVVNMV